MKFARGGRVDPCVACGRPMWVVVGKVRVSGRWLTLIPLVYATRADARAYVMTVNRASSPGSETIYAVAPANSWWWKWPGIWTRIAWIHVREYWQAITLLDRSLAAMKRVFGRGRGLDPMDRLVWKPPEPIADTKRKIREGIDDDHDAV